MKIVDTIANAMLTMFCLCLPICFLTFAAGPNDRPVIVYVGMAAFLYVKYALFIAIPLKVFAYFCRWVEK